ncbi:MAG TPA: hypothetical protein VFS33_01550 [Gemmatimonadales bacterium]|nr:hypothetical protein [Gemmatimonadales bacterium]
MMRTPTILDVIRAVTEVAPLHPEVAVWWYVRASTEAGNGARGVQVVLEARDGIPPDVARIGPELGQRLGGATVSARMHRGAAEAAPLYRVLTAGNPRLAADHSGGR